jgi:hypothetical protein
MSQPTSIIPADKSVKPAARQYAVLGPPPPVIPQQAQPTVPAAPAASSAMIQPPQQPGPAKTPSGMAA